MANERHILCVKCNKYVGLIRDAKLMKGLTFLCPSCTAEIIDKPKKTKSTFDEMFSEDAFGRLFSESMFGDIFGKNDDKG